MIGNDITIFTKDTLVQKDKNILPNHSIVVMSAIFPLKIQQF